MSQRYVELLGNINLTRHSHWPVCKDGSKRMHGNWLYMQEMQIRNCCWACWYTPVIPALGRPRQKDCKFKVSSLGYIARSVSKQSKTTQKPKKGRRMGFLCVCWGEGRLVQADLWGSPGHLEHPHQRIIFRPQRHLYKDYFWSNRIIIIS
jgi:hypothetical protein